MLIKLGKTSDPKDKNTIVDQLKALIESVGTIAVMIDMGPISVDNINVIEILARIVSSCQRYSYCKVAVALSSGGGYFMKQSLLWNTMLLINSMACCRFFDFMKDEAEIYLQTKGVQLNIETSQQLTNFNPRLLSLLGN